MATFHGNENEMEVLTKGRLTNLQYVRLGRAISSPDMESIALGYLNIDKAVIKSLKNAHRENTEAFNRDIIELWANRNSGPDQVKVKLIFLRTIDTPAHCVCNIQQSAEIFHVCC